MHRPHSENFKTKQLFQLFAMQFHSRLDRSNIQFHGDKLLSRQSGPCLICLLVHVISWLLLVQWVIGRYNGRIGLINCEYKPRVDCHAVQRNCSTIFHLKGDHSVATVLFRG
jgi:hypothetical protein